MPCRHSRSSTGLGPGDRSGQGGSNGSISAHKPSSTIHGRVVTRRERSNHHIGHARPGHLNKILLRALMRLFDRVGVATRTGAQRHAPSPVPHSPLPQNLSASADPRAQRPLTRGREVAIPLPHARQRRDKGRAGTGGGCASGDRGAVLCVARRRGLRAGRRTQPLARGGPNLMRLRVTQCLWRGGAECPMPCA